MPGDRGGAGLRRFPACGEPSPLPCHAAALPACGCSSENYRPSKSFVGRSPGGCRIREQLKNSVGTGGRTIPPRGRRRVEQVIAVEFPRHIRTRMLMMSADGLH